MTLHQNYRGACFIDRTGSSRRLENTALVVPAATAIASEAIVFRVTDLESGTVHHIHRVGEAATNSPTIGLRHTASTNTITVRLNTSAQTVIGTFTISTGVNYCLVWVWNSGGLNLTNHPDAASGDYAICYLYDLSTRTPTATISKSNAAALANQLAGGAETTGVRWDSQTSNRTSWAFSDTALWFGTALTKAQADQLGQRVRDARQIGTVPTHFWKTAYRIGAAGSLTTVSASPAGTELHHLADLGSGTARDLTATGGSGERPSWLATSLRQDIAVGEDTRLNASVVNAIPQSLNLSAVKTAIANGAAGTIVGLYHDSFGRPNLVARDGGHEAAGWVEYGYSIIGTTSYLNSGLAGGSSLRTGVALVGGSSGVTLGYLANGANQGEEGGGNYSTLPGTGATRFGLPIGGLAEVVFGSTPTFTGVTFRIRSDCGSAGAGSNRNWFSSGDRIGILPVVYRTSVSANNFDGVLRFTTGAHPSGVDWDQADADDYRAKPRTHGAGAAAAWSNIEAGTGGATIADDALFAFKDYIVCGTGAASYDVTVTCPSGTIADKRLYLTVLAFRLDANDRPIVGTNSVFVMHLGDDSLDMNSDLTTAGVPTARGQKTFTTEQLADWYAICAPRRAMNIAQWIDVATENANTATTTTRVRQWMGSTDATTPRLTYAVKTLNAMNGTLILGMIDQFCHKISNTTTRPGQDGSRMIDVAQAYHAVAVNGDELNTTDAAAFYSYGRMSGRYWSFPEASETSFTEMGLSETNEAENDSTVSAAVGSLPICNADRLHIGNETAAKNFAWARIAAIDAAPVIPPDGGASSGPPLRGLRLDRAGRSR